MAAAWRLLPTDQAGTTTSAVSEDAPTTATVQVASPGQLPGVLHSCAAAGPGPTDRPTSPSRAPWQVPRRQSTARDDPASRSSQSRTCGASPDQPGMPCNPEPQQRSTAKAPYMSRWRTTRPEEAGIGAVPHRCAKAASPWSRSGLSPALTRSCPATSTPTPRRLPAGSSRGHRHDEGHADRGHNRPGSGISSGAR